MSRHRRNGTATRCAILVVTHVDGAHCLTGPGLTCLPNPEQENANAGFGVVGGDVFRNYQSGYGWRRGQYSFPVLNSAESRKIP
jgi:hypothetical protein